VTGSPIWWCLLVKILLSSLETTTGHFGKQEASRLEQRFPERWWQATSTTTVNWTLLSLMQTVL
jgi:hypothetical protein